MSGDITASMIGLVFTRKVAFATVVSLTAKINVAKCRLSTEPEIATSSISRFPSDLRLCPERASKIMARAAMNNRKNVSEIAEAPVANLMKMALEPKKMDAMNRISRPLEEDKMCRISDQINFAGCEQ
jgi:hypothetical protein